MDAFGGWRKLGVVDKVGELGWMLREVCIAQDVELTPRKFEESSIGSEVDSARTAEPSGWSLIQAWRTRLRRL